MVIEPYRPRTPIVVPDPSPLVAASTMSARVPLTSILDATALPRNKRLYLLTTTATWCEACHRRQPQLRRLAARFGELALCGIPVDPIETAEQLRNHAQQTQPAFQIAAEIQADDREAILSVIRRQLNTEAIPCSLLVDAEGRVLQAFLSVPTASDIGRWINQFPRDGTGQSPVDPE
jgi:hypothetical protein